MTHQHTLLYPPWVSSILGLSEFRPVFLWSVRPSHSFVMTLKTVLLCTSALLLSSLGSCATLPPSFDADPTLSPSGSIASPTASPTASASSELLTCTGKDQGSQLTHKTPEGI